MEKKNEFTHVNKGTSQFYFCVACHKVRAPPDEICEFQEEAIFEEIKS